MNGTTPQDGEGEMIVIDSVDDFANALNQWHQNKVAIVRHMMTIPTGTEVTDDDGKTLVLQGEALDAFKLGLHVALTEFGKLPFTPVEDEGFDLDTANQ